MFPFKRPNPKAHYFMRLGSDMVLLEAHGPEQTPYLRCTGGLTGHPAHLHGMTVLNASKKSTQTFRTVFLLCTKPLHSSLLITRILVRGECHFQNIWQFILFESHFFSAEAKKTGDYCYLFLPDNYPDGKGWHIADKSRKQPTENALTPIPLLF